ncbi:hypothetical protein [Pendulispora albinea]|uniref:Uncharacterized protein n=1 Tax=Pendulispora albinea TaxID=2741071 RepID=A0ABZ2MC67_9BACT
MNFPSAQAAMVTQKMTTYVFDATNLPNLCHELVAKRVSAAGTWPVAPIAESSSSSTCDVLRSPSSAKIPPVPFGQRAVAIIGFGNDGNAVMIGCTHLTTGAGNFQVPVSLTAIDPDNFKLRVEGVKCSRFVQFCEGNCTQ